MGTAVLLMLASLVSPLASQEGAAAVPQAIVWEGADLWIAETPFDVNLLITAPQEGLELPIWALTPAAFEVNGKPLGKRPRGMIELSPGQVVETHIDLGAAIETVGPEGTFTLACGLEGSSEVREVLSPVPLAEKIDFMTIPEEELGGFEVIMLTNRGAMWFELWPKVAPNHVRNFLDLSSSGFYDGSNFHRVIPGFMIQGGGAKQGEQAPRKVDAEFSARKHEAGVLSAARLGNDVNSATSQFFVMHRNYPSLNGRYTPYGKLKSGMEVVEKIVITGDSRFSPNTPKGSTPTTPQDILRAIVVRAKPSPGKAIGK